MLSIGIFFFAAFVMKPAPQRMSREIAGDAGCGRPPSQDARDVAGIESRLRQPPAQVECPEDWSGRAHGRQPALKRRDRAE